MTIYKRFLDEKDSFEIDEFQARETLVWCFEDVDLALKEIEDGQVIHTASAIYANLPSLLEG